MRIAVLGATSQIARDFVLTADETGDYLFSLYARRPDAALQWVRQNNLKHIERVDGFEGLGLDLKYDAVINFVGVGNPATAQSMGATILDITLDFDNLALDYIRKHPATRYIFFSSGAAYGSAFQAPVNDETTALFDINHLQSQDWYGIAKFHAESRHRALLDFPIIDIRVFSYFSYSQDLSARFLMSEVFLAIKTGSVFKTSSENIVRDYLGPHDLHQMIRKMLQSTPTNVAVDCFTKRPIEKFQMLDALKTKFGLSYRLTEVDGGINATGCKKNYYSTNHRASTIFGYSPTFTSLETIINQSEMFLAR